MDDHRLDVYELFWLLILSVIMYLIIGAIK